MLKFCEVGGSKGTDEKQPRMTTSFKMTPIHVQTLDSRESCVKTGFKILHNSGLTDCLQFWAAGNHDDIVKYADEKGNELAKLI